MDNALRRVVYDVLTITRDLGAAPGEHHFYIEFLTTAPGVSIPDALVESYPERMTIVLQHQFKDLQVYEERFEVTLWFKGEPSRLRVPFDAVTAFADPSVHFDLRFTHFANGDAADLPATDTPDAEDEATAEAGAEVVSLDSFRKK
ncbi:MAG: stringent starvation protein B [Alphaproteobacteria bacterium]|nr:stringent starvation protein B [Alphaproteobacteria bacterium]